jgi:hypothetical protein
MKRVVFVGLLALAFAVLLCGQAASKDRPANYVAPFETDADDHTWGGENEVGGDFIEPDETPTINTGFWQLDVLLNSTYLKALNVLGDRFRTSGPSAPPEVDSPNPGDNPTTTITSSTKGD